LADTETGAAGGTSLVPSPGDSVTGTGTEVVEV